MEYIITRLSYDTVKASARGYYPFKGSFKGFFDDLKSYVNRPAYVKRVIFDNHTIFIDKLDPEFGYIFTDSYVIDGLLEADIRFEEYLNSFLVECDNRKEELASNVEEAIKVRNINLAVLRTAVGIYKKYSESGEVESIDDPEIAKGVVGLFKSNDFRVYTDFSYTLDGDIVTRPQVEFDTEGIQRLKIATGVSGVAAGALVITSFVVSNPITIFAGVAAGIGCYCANNKKKQLNTEEAKRILTELGEIYGEMYPLESVEEGSYVLTKNKTES